MKKTFSNEFLIQWRKQYNKIRWLGNLIKEEQKDRSPESHLAKLDRKLQKLILEHKKFMDKNDCKLPRPAWVYDVYNKETWASSEDFAYIDQLQFR